MRLQAKAALRLASVKNRGVNIQWHFIAIAIKTMHTFNGVIYHCAEFNCIIAMHIIAMQFDQLPQNLSQSNCI